MVLPGGKRFAKAAEDILDLATGHGGCIASDRITVDGAPVGYMYREEPDDETVDSGWRFLAGDEDEAYMDDANLHGVYDVNTIANYDREIIPYLLAPPGSEFEREEPGEPLLPVDPDTGETEG